jgi:hypothetical protein
MKSLKPGMVLPVILVLRRMMQEDHKLQANLGYTGISRPT